jgi:aryl-alcohol dehydrogenase-like predicted oxidoreductase
MNMAIQQVLMRRGIEWDLLPWCRERGIPIMAYSAIEQGSMLDHGSRDQQRPPQPAEHAGRITIAGGKERH